MFRPLKITFKLDGTGVYFDPAEPIHFDSLLCCALAHHHVQGEAPDRDGVPADIPIPLRKWFESDTWGWRASALFPDGDTIESLQFWRKKFRQSRVELTAGSPNLTNGTYREYNMPMPLTLCHSMVCWAFGDRQNVRRALARNITHLGKKRSMGKGVINDIVIEAITEDHSLRKDGIAQRWLPAAEGTRLVRPRPPYWNNHSRINCCEVGASMGRS